MEDSKRHVKQNGRSARLKSVNPVAPANAFEARKPGTRRRSAAAGQQVCWALRQDLEPATPRVARIFEFITKLRIPSGVGQGEPFALYNFQRKWLNGVFGPTMPDGRRQIRRALLSVARKNGKTPLMAALILCFLVGPEAGFNYEIVSAASDRDQAATIYKFCKQMIELDEELPGMLGCLDSVKRIVCYHNGNVYKALSADARRQHGGGPTLIIYDELAQAQDRELYDVLSTSQDAMPEGLFIVISTQSSDPASIMSELVDDALAIQKGMLEDPYYYGEVYAVPDDTPADRLLTDPDIWRLANPALGGFKMLETVEAQALKARRSPSAAAAFKNLHLNMRVDGNAAFVNSEDWKACAGFIPDEDLVGVECFGGLDLSGRRDLTSLELVFPLPDGTAAVRSVFWTHSEELEKRAKEDGALYPLWRDQGHLTVLPTRSIDYAAVARQIGELWRRYKIRSINFDRYRIQDLIRALEDEGIPAIEYTKDAETAGKLVLVKHGQGFIDMSPAIDELEEVILSNTLRHGGHPVLTYCMSNVRLTRDPAGNRKFDKRQERRRIDGAVALAMAVSGWKRAEPAKAPGRSVYEERGVLVF